MCSHRFSTTLEGKQIEVLAGWDRPLQGHFCVVEDTSLGDDSYLYSNLDDPDLTACMGMPPELDYFLVKLEQLGIKIPAKMIEEIRSDKEVSMGNRIVTYDESGAMFERTRPGEGAPMR